MDNQQDLTKANRETLLSIIAEQQIMIDELKKRISVLETRLNSRGKTGMPGNKPRSTRREERKEERKRRAHGFARERMTPTHRVEHAVEVCPDCGTHLSGGWVQRRREVIDIPLVPVQVTEHVVVARVCPVCDIRRVPKLSLGGDVVGKQRLGVNLVSLITTLREEGRWPFRMIQWYLKSVHQLRLSIGSIVDATKRVAGASKPSVERIVDRIRGSPMVHADETGWREEGVNGYVWTFSTQTEQYFLRRGRDKGVVDEVLDESFDGVLVSDFYAAYNHYPGLKQRCWTHLLRDIHDLKTLYPEDDDLLRWAGSVHKIYKEAKKLSYPDQKRRRQAQVDMEQKLLAVCQTFVDDPLAVQRRLCRRIERFINELFVFVAEPPSENNAAERSLRHLVISRKISGGTRSKQGTDSKMALSSLFGTWRARGLNPFVECRNLLSSPQL